MRYFPSPSILTSFGLLSMMLLGPEPAQAAVPDGLVTITPEEIDDILANPGMGWQTFHRTRTQDRNLPSWIPSTVHHARWGWAILEP